jgi:hypothetical protein
VSTERDTRLILGADTTELDRTLIQKDQEVKNANLAMISAIRQTATASILVLQVVGVAIDQVFALLVEAVLTTIEVVVAIKGATFGISQVFQIGQIVGMLLLIRQIRQKRTKAAQQTNAAIMLARMGAQRTA